MQKNHLSGLVLLLTAVIGCTDSVPKELTSPPDKNLVIQRMHHRFSAESFNKCWTLIDKKDRSPQDVENMILCASASMWHWKQRSDRKPLNMSIGYGQLSRVYALSGQHDMAKTYGQRCLKTALKGPAPPFYIGYAYEALTRAEIGLKNFKSAAYNLENAQAQLKSVTDTEERGWLKADLDELKKTIADRTKASER